MKTKKLVTTAMLLAFALILSLIQLIRLPFGGTVTPASMTPIVILAFVYGTKWGIFSSFVYSILQMLVGMSTVSAFFLPGESHMALASAICICIIDYIGAYTALGLAGAFKNRFKTKTTSLCTGVFVALTVKYIMHIISGAVFFGAWAEWFFTDTSGLMQIDALSGFCAWVMNTFDGYGLALFYSVIYNGAYMIPEIIITVIAAPFIYKILTKAKLLTNT